MKTEDLTTQELINAYNAITILIKKNESNNDYLGVPFSMLSETEQLHYINLETKNKKYRAIESKIIEQLEKKLFELE